MALSLPGRDLSLFYDDWPGWGGSADPFSLLMPFATGSSRVGKAAGRHRDMPLDVKEVCTLFTAYFTALECFGLLAPTHG
jgi:hypothetical protein